jgi:HAE1 family hydrophobic/amphiphilic exporter-1
VVVAFRGAPVYLRDVAEVVDGFAERNTLTRLNGQDSVVITIQRQSGTNTTQVAREAKRILEDIQASNPNLNIAITEDTSLFIEASTEDAVVDLLLGALIAFFVVLYFFRSVRNTFITMSGLPVIFLGTLFLMDAFGLSLNLVTLLALALVVGLVIDDAIVVRENIFRWMERGYSAKEAASKGTAEVVLPVLATSATILAVFLPIAYAEGIVGQIFLAFGLTVAFAIIVSTFEALTMAPMLSAYFFGQGEDKERQVDEGAAREEEEGRSKLDRAYGRALGWVLDHRWLSLGISVIVIGISIGSATLLNVSFLPPLDQGRLTVRMEMPAGTPLNVTSQEAQQVESILMMHPEIELVSTRVGGQGTPEQARFAVVLREGGNSRAVIEQLRDPLQAVPGVSFQGTDSAFGGGRDVQIDLVSLDGNYTNLIAASEIIAEIMVAQPELADIEVSYEAAKSELQFRVDRQQAAQFGFTTAQVGSSLRTLLNGEVVSSFRGEGADADIRMRLQESDRSSVDQLRQISLLSTNGQFVPLSSIATTGFAQGPSSIQRVDRQSTITVGANAVAGDRVAATAAAEAILADQSMLPPGVTARLGGNAGQQADSFQNLFLALGLSVIFIYMVLASQFASFVQPLIIMISMPLAVLGAFAGLVITGRPLDTTAFIGFIMLMGLVTKNSILLVDFANRQRRELGRTATEAMRAAGPVRLRPILMTAVSLILAMIPIASGVGAGGDFRAPMATGIIGGMFTSTLLTLFIVPLAYSMIVGWQEKRFGREAPWAAANVQNAPSSSPSAPSVQQPQEALQAGD